MQASHVFGCDTCLGSDHVCAESALRRLAAPWQARAVGVVRYGAAINLTGQSLSTLSFWRSSKIQNTLAMTLIAPLCRRTGKARQTGRQCNSNQPNKQNLNGS